MKRSKHLKIAAASAVLLLFTLPASSQIKNRIHITIPASSTEITSDIGLNAHTSIQMALTPHQLNGATAQPAELPPFAGYLFETPASAACVYHLASPRVPGCNPNLTTVDVTGGSKAIAIVDAYDDPNAAADLAFFSAQFGLPKPNFSVVYASTKPAIDPTGGWEVEESLDIEWAHAMAPSAKIFLVEAKTNSFANLLAAVQVASEIVAFAGGGEVSMSWGGSEFAQETEYDSYFTTPGVVYTASAGDSPGVIWPGASPNVVAAGGTSLSRDLLTGMLISENTWQDAGSGFSDFESRPKFQKSIESIVGPSRGVPDMSFDSNPNTGVWVWDSNPIPTAADAGWYVVGGTSVAAPSLAGIINLSGQFSATSKDENTLIYKSAAAGVGFKDVTYGNCGLNISEFTMPGWDFCTGVGSPRGLNGK
jgi:subtilase family serine protease